MHILGKLGGIASTPMINMPEVAIIGVHKIEEKPAVREPRMTRVPLSGSWSAASVVSERSVASTRRTSQG